jgi:peptidoglycan/LPS O-acetylase OafA/YrhL
VFVGTISYGIYLVHLLAMNCVRMLIDKQINYSSCSISGFLATCVLTGCTAYVLAVLIERPCIRLGRRCRPS